MIRNFLNMVAVHIEGLKGHCRENSVSNKHMGDILGIQ
jgi:hypothetical protein